MVANSNTVVGLLPARSDSLFRVSKASCADEGLGGAIVRQCFMFTDLVASTRRWESEPDRMHLALSRHDEIIDAVTRSHGGTVFKWLGDGCCVRFSTPYQAQSAAYGIWARFRSEPWHTSSPLTLRIALHCGPVLHHQHHEFVGPTMNQTSRLLEICGADQILATAGVVDAAITSGRRSPVAWRPLGFTRLRDVRVPVEVFAAEPPVESDSVDLRDSSRASSPTTRLSALAGLTV